MRKSIICAAVFLATISLSINTFAKPPKAGDPMPKIDVGTVYNNDEYNVDFDDLKGYVVVVEFWATWCGPCKKTIPHLNDLHEKYADKGVVIIGISDEDDKTVRPFLKKMKMDYLVIAGSEAMKTYGVNGIPHAFIVDTNGIVQWDGHPGMPAFEQAIEKAIEETPPTRMLGGGPEHNERVLTAAEKAIQAGDIELALVSLRRIDQKSIMAGEGHSTRLKSILANIEPIAQSKYDDAMKNLKNENYLEAIAAFKYLATNYNGIPSTIGDKAAAQLKKLENDPRVQQAKRSAANEKLANNMLKRAKKSAAADQHESAYRKLIALIEKYPETASADEAKKLVAVYEADDEFMKKMVDKVGG